MLKKITKIIFFVFLFIAILFFVLKYSGSIRESEIPTPFKGMAVKFNDETMYQAGDIIDFESQSGKILTSDIIPNQVVEVSGRQYYEQALHIPTVSIPAGATYKVLKLTSYREVCYIPILCWFVIGDNVPVDTYHLQSDDGKVFKMRAYMFDNQENSHNIIVQ